MFNLFDNLKEVMEKDPKKYGAEGKVSMVPTGFMNIDYLNGIAIKQDNGNIKISKGIDCGKIITIIGKSGSGKTTLAIQIASSIVKPFEQSTIFFLDAESGTTESRIRMVTGMSHEEYKTKVSLKHGISTDMVIRNIAQIHKLKLEHEKELLMDDPDGNLDDDGRIKRILPPTVVIVDSIAMLVPEGGDDDFDDGLQGQMLATKMAKANTQMAKFAVSRCNSANIILIFINHITQKVSTGPTPVASSINFLKQDESLPGGNAIQYLTNTLIKTVTSSKLDEEKTYGIKGFYVKVELIKSRTAPAGSVTNLIYDQVNGFDNELSMLEYLKDNSFIKGGGLAYYVEGMDTVKFRLSNFKQKLAENPAFKEYFYNFTENAMKNAMRVSNRWTVTNEAKLEEIPVEIVDTEAPEEV